MSSGHVLVRNAEWPAAKKTLKLFLPEVQLLEGPKNGWFMPLKIEAPFLVRLLGLFFPDEARRRQMRNDKA